MTLETLIDTYGYLTIFIGTFPAGKTQGTLPKDTPISRRTNSLFMDFLTNIPFAEYLLERITEIRCRMAARYAEAGVNVIRLGDDFGTQQSLMMSPSTFRDLVKPRLARIIDSAKPMLSERVTKYQDSHLFSTFCHPK